MDDRKSREVRVRREHILEAARQVVGERGVEHTRLQDVARAAGYTRRTLYAYFGNRDDLLLALYCRDLEARSEVQRRALSAEHNGLERLIVWGRELYSHMVQHPHELELQLYWDFHGVQKELISDEVFAEFDAVNLRVAGSLTAALAAGLTDGSVRQGLNPAWCVSQYLVALRAVVGRALGGGYSAFPVDDADGYVEQYLQLFRRSIAATR